MKVQSLYRASAGFRSHQSLSLNNMKAGPLFYLSTILAGASALPSLGSLSAQRDIAHIAYDEDNGQFMAFKCDGSLYGRYITRGPLLSGRSAGQCVNLTVDEAKSLPGWGTIEKYANDNWGDGSRNIVTNPTDYPGSPAQVCVSGDPVKVELDGDPQCQDRKVDNVSGTAGTNGSVTLQIQQGSNMTSEYTVTTVSTLGISNTFSVSLGIPLLDDVAEASVGDETTVSSEVTNEQTKSFAATYSDVATIARTIDTEDGKTCSVDLTLHSCTAKSKAQIRYVATGFVWFNYNDKTKGHYKWAAKIDSILSNEDDRSSFAEIQGPIASDTHSSSNATCVDS
ncbi:uncharacterized protein EV420DRAFT_657537 [Desarmillaria tabescens]|uniref:Uncharacterized protein n=1 Tax=Armillaria tabescens TaxID=1929756 RepID=A0AA39NJU3_ARMTA|nr:uncharacterized protein EV420DRAFT_657537 [Desarmillaria tabescens]KAK0466966.1 hypothetical protein EV420DRAFT_657537 [Desarmillaria tabescens]